MDLLLDRQNNKDLDDLREKCKSAVPTAERNLNSEARLRPKSSMNNSNKRASSASKSTATAATGRPKTCKGTKLDKKQTEVKPNAKKKTSTNGNKPRKISKLTSQDMDENGDNEIRLVDDEDLDEDGSRFDESIS